MISFIPRQKIQEEKKMILANTKLTNKVLLSILLTNKHLLHKQVINMRLTNKILISIVFNQQVFIPQSISPQEISSQTFNSCMHNSHIYLHSPVISQPISPLLNFSPLIRMGNSPTNSHVSPILLPLYPVNYFQ